MKGWLELRKFYRSREQKLIAGVCGGIAEKFGMSPFVVRLIFIGLIAFAGLPILAVYGGLWIFFPYGPEEPFS